ncbi:MAG TPA: ABC transporter ATP-binding protein [Actinomycetota bacterium]
MTDVQATTTGVLPAPDREPVVHTSALTKYFGTTAAVRDLTFEVEHGSITGVVGPNGAGKSTTFLMLSTLLSPTEGEMAVCGFDPIAESSEVRRHVGYVPDFFGIYDDLTVTEYLHFFAATYGIRGHRREVLASELLELVDLGVKADSPVNSLSRGMKQRLCLARALVHDPQLLILDEPASGLDPRARIELRALLRELQRMGKSILISSHILTELEEVCSHVAILEAGQLVTYGSPADLRGAYSGLRRFRIRVMAGRKPMVLALLEQREDVTVVDDTAWGDEVVEVEMSGEDDMVAALLAFIVANGIALVEFTELRAGIEDIFLRATKGTVS